MKVGVAEELLGRRLSRAVDRCRRRDRDRALRPGGDDRLERIDVAQLVAQDEDRAGPVALEQPPDGLALPAGLGGPQVDDRPAAVMRKAVVVQPLTALD